MDGGTPGCEGVGEVVVTGVTRGGFGRFQREHTSEGVEARWRREAVEWHRWMETDAILCHLLGEAGKTMGTAPHVEAACGADTFVALPVVHND